MKNIIIPFCVTLGMLSCLSCEKPSQETPVPDKPEETIPEKDNGFVESVPDTISFTNAEFIYNGDDIGEATSDGWIIKMYTDMEIDEAGAPIGPGCVLQMLLNVKYDEDQSGKQQLLCGIYTEMLNSGNFAPGTFVSGYMTYIDLPGQRLELADATYFADVADGSTEMDYDLLDEGAVVISENEDGSCTIEGILVGKKFTKRYFTWTGEVKPRNNVPEEIPNSTLRTNLTDLSFTKGLMIDKGDIFFLGNETYRCFRLFLVDDGAEFPFDRPTGTTRVLRLEILVPWETDCNEGIPAGTYRMITRNADTSIDKDNIVPGGAVTGLPDVFAEWKMGGSWYYELEDGAWGQTYARINGGTITVERGNDGSHTISYDLIDCQKSPKRITGSTTLSDIQIY